MARMYSRKKGKSGSKKPFKKTPPTWVRYKPKEIEMLIVRIAKEGETPSKIGIHLRDVYGIPSVKNICKKRICDILEEKKLLHEIPEDMFALMKRAVLIKRHIDINKNDMSAKRGLQLTESKIKKLAKYYKRTGKLAPTWKYDPERIKMIV
jgi:small subunit ribosomal protein S15